MSTLPFLLSVADELDNINSQSYMDDFGLGFHPHRQYYRTPTIQLSLPASTDWMQQERQQRWRPHKFYDESQNNLQPTGEEDDDDDAAAGNGAESANNYATTDRYGGGKGGGASSSAATVGSSSRQRYTSALNSNALTGCGKAAGTATKAEDDDDDENIDNSVRMYNLSKKCCKNYHRHAVETHARDSASCSAVGNTATTAGTTASGGSAVGTSSAYKLHSKCMEGNNSSSDESLQKVSSSIEFLTCFLLKKSRASSSSSKNSAGGGPGGSGKKSS